MSQIKCGILYLAVAWQMDLHSCVDKQALRHLLNKVEDHVPRKREMPQASVINVRAEECNDQVDARECAGRTP